MVLTGRPARVQCTLDITYEGTGPRDIEMLYTPEATSQLKFLRHQIEVAQGRSAGAFDGEVPSGVTMAPAPPQTAPGARGSERTTP